MPRLRKLLPEVLNAALEGLQAQRQRIEAQIAQVRSMLLRGLANTAATLESTPRRRRKFSAATRLKMRKSQQARWARVRGESEPAPAKVAAKPKRRITKEGMARIVAATKKKIAKKVVKNSAPAKAAKKTVKKAAKKAAAAKTAPVAAQAVAEVAAE